MKYVKYPGTDKMVSVVGFGGLRFDLSKSNEENAKLIEYAYEKGINYFDTAPGYCDDRSEDIFGIAFRRLRAEGKTNFFVSTKSKPKMADTKEKAIAVVHRSLERLGIDKIDFYHVWCVRKMEHYELSMCQGGQFEGLLQCKGEGLIDHMMFSSHQPGDEVISILDDKKFVGVTLGVNILNYGYRWSGISHAYKNGYGVVAMNPLCGGEIPSHEKELAFLAAPGETVTEAALRFNIGSPEITITLVGFGSKKDIDDACRIADEGVTNSKEDLEKIKVRFGENMSSMCTGCGYCRVCKVGINTPGYMLFYNEKHIFGKSREEMVDLVYGLEYWNYSANTKSKAGACIGCGKCEEECTQHLPIIERLKEIAKWEADGVDNITV